MKDVTIYKEQEFAGITAFQRMLNKAPLKRHIRQSPSSDKASYLPIGHIENQLDEMYTGLWQTEATVELMGNSIVATVTLKVFHPTAKLWLSRTGIGAKKVQLNKGAAAMDTSQMKADAFEKGAPAAKSMALRNAAQSLGQAFGRNLNRDLDEPLMYLDEQAEALTEDSLEAMALLQTSTLPDNTREMITKKIEQASARELKEIVKYLNTKQL